MAKETQKQKIERLEQENKVLRQEQDQLTTNYRELLLKIGELENLHDDDFVQSSSYRQLMGQIELFTQEIQIKNKKILRLESKTDSQAQLIQELQMNFKEPQHNERGAGRKARSDREEIKMQAKHMHQSGVSMRKIAKELNCSAGLVCKLINEY